MEEKEKLQLINEIKQIERQLHIKKSQLASAEAMQHEAGLFTGLDVEGWKQRFSQLAKEIGQTSNGGDSVEDVAKERHR